MHVAINALSLTNRSGTGRYTWGLIHGFIQWAPPDFFLSVLIPSQFPIPLNGIIPPRRGFIPSPWVEPGNASCGNKDFCPPG